MFQPPNARWVFLTDGTTGPTRHCETTSFLVPRTGRWGHFVVHFMGSEWISPKDSSGMPCLTPDDAVHPCPGKPLVPRMWSGFLGKLWGAQQTPMELEFIFFITINKIAKDCWGCFVCLFVCFFGMRLYILWYLYWCYIFHRWKFLLMRVCSLLSV